MAVTVIVESFGEGSDVGVAEVVGVDEDDVGLLGCMERAECE